MHGNLMSDSRYWFVFDTVRIFSWAFWAIGVTFGIQFRMGIWCRIDMRLVYRYDNGFCYAVLWVGWRHFAFLWHQTILGSRGCGYMLKERRFWMYDDVIPTRLLHTVLSWEKCSSKCRMTSFACEITSYGSGYSEVMDDVIRLTCDIIRYRWEYGDGSFGWRHTADVWRNMAWARELWRRL